MAFVATSSRVLRLLALLLAIAATEAATITVVNRCSYTVWLGTLPGGRARLDLGKSWAINLPVGTRGARLRPRTGCTFNGSSHGRCITGDCGGVLACTVFGQQPTTLVEYTLSVGRDQDFFDLFMIDGFNGPMSIQLTNGGAVRTKSL